MSIWLMFFLGKIMRAGINSPPALLHAMTISKDLLSAEVSAPICRFPLWSTRNFTLFHK